jgi:hypothetical protein
LQAGTDLTLSGGGEWSPTGGLNLSAGATIHFTGGDYSLAGGGSLAGTLDTATAATVRLTTGTFSLQQGAAITGDGFLQVAGATLEVAGNVTARNFDLNFGTLSGPGVFSVTDTLKWIGGAMSGSGSTDLGSGATMYVLGTAAGDDNRYLLGRTFNNAGTIIWIGIRPIITDDNGATFNNLASGTILARSDSGFVNQDVNSSLGVTFNNAGTLRKEAGTGVMLFDVGTFNVTVRPRSRVSGSENPKGLWLTL